MSGDKSAISEARSDEEIGEFWDHHDLGEHWAATQPAEFTVEIGSQSTYFAVEPTLSARLRVSAAKRGVSAETLLNLWLQERVTQEVA